jgi:hypothetical protein
MARSFFWLRVVLVPVFAAIASVALAMLISQIGVVDAVFFRLVQAVGHWIAIAALLGSFVVIAAFSIFFFVYHKPEWSWLSSVISLIIVLLLMPIVLLSFLEGENIFCRLAGCYSIQTE